MRLLPVLPAAVLPLAPQVLQLNQDPTTSLIEILPAPQVTLTNCCPEHSSGGFGQTCLDVLAPLRGEQAPSRINSKWGRERDEKGQEGVERGKQGDGTCWALAAVVQAPVISTRTVFLQRPL